ncbi:MAG: DUF5694 domain-containing protein [Cyclobacteriaceae bacterium]
MKTIIYSSLLIISCWCQAQRVDVLIVGTVHHFSDEYLLRQDFEKVQKDIVSYDPDIICIEAIPTFDTLSLAEILPRNMKRADSLKADLSVGTYQTATPSQLLGAERFANYDFWNAYYAWDSLGTGDQAPGPFSKFHRSLKNTEYGNIVFPAARTLGVDQFQNIDYRFGEKAFLANNNKVMKKLLFKLKLKPIRSYLKIQKRYKKAHEAGNLMDFVNGEAFQKSFSTLIDELPDMLKKSEEAKSVTESWHKRNSIMAKRIYQSAMENRASKVLVTVGAAHVHHIKFYLESLGCTVTTYGEFQKSNLKSN